MKVTKTCLSQTAAFSLFLTLTLGAPLLTVILVLFGAPFLTHTWHNVLCATHVALIGVLPLFYVHGVDSRMWREICGASLPFDEVWGATIGAIVRLCDPMAEVALTVSYRWEPG